MSTGAHLASALYAAFVSSAQPHGFESARPDRRRLESVTGAMNPASHRSAAYCPRISAICRNVSTLRPFVEAYRADAVRALTPGLVDASCHARAHPS